MLKWANDGSILIGVNQSYCHRNRVFCYNLFFDKCAKYIMGTFLLVITLPDIWVVNEGTMRMIFFLKYFNKNITPTHFSKNCCFTIISQGMWRAYILRHNILHLALANLYPITTSPQPYTGLEIKWVLSKWPLNEKNWDNYCT